VQRVIDLIGNFPALGAQESHAIALTLPLSHPGKGTRCIYRSPLLTSGAETWQKDSVKTTKTGKTKKTVKKAARPTKAAAPPRRAKKPGASAARGKKAVTVRPEPAVAAAARPSRRAIFIDVENTSSEAELFEAIDHLQIDRQTQPVELTAVGNWRAVGPLVARRLGALGAQLVHSAPARGVRDWSDLWIAVAAGCWLGQAAAGDVLEIISNDRAFDAVGDAAAGRGVVFRRLQHQRGPVAVAPAAAPKRPRRTRGGRRRGRRRGENIPVPQSAAPPSAPPHPRPAPARPTAPYPAPAALVEEPHGASRDQMLAVIRRLTHNEPGRWVNLDVLEKALKHEGFSRPPGSPRLVTRLRALKDVEVDAHGRVRIVPAAADGIVTDTSVPNGVS
jgi:hypothetical protein